MFAYRAGKGEIEIFGKVVQLPRQRRTSIALGVALVVLGLFGFLPVLGFWMIPLGLLVLSREIPSVRRWRRKAALRYGRRRGAGKGGETTRKK
ncbi:hypothetical protein [Pseudohoeflea coraliihabitans]|uniref:Transmembrane protein PGPGW n=1 Tax=Pseudohoeflea coraliihabitans TaxID=2860393 RepID=A0ABS6WQ65_9HYPH|nr:hypothetical protein [Pseudohoeflea sp. DP4N28-3]MBW3098104.1 hypothetical protein [Pseudohoeflea sp. DP4N28-3]